MAIAIEYGLARIVGKPPRLRTVFLRTFRDPNLILNDGGRAGTGVSIVLQALSFHVK